MCFLAIDIQIKLEMILIKSYIDDKLDMIIKNRGDVMSRNPYTPGAGTPPAFLAGRDATIDEIVTRIKDTIDGGMARHTIYYGVRGVGKTVLLTKIESLFSDSLLLSDHLECLDGTGLSRSIALAVKKFIKKMSLWETSKDFLEKAVGIFKSFTLTWNPNDGAFTVGLDGDVQDGVADTGDFTSDLIDLLTVVGKLAKKNGHAICFFIDEIQSLKPMELTALITAIHRTNQLQLPIIIIGAGLPTILRISSESKSYSERLFSFVEIASLKWDDAIAALVEPAMTNGISFDPNAIDYIVKETGGYPYFLQEYGRCVWRYIDKEFISLDGAKLAYKDYIGTLDESFFSARYNRSTSKEKEFLYAMSKCKAFPCAMSDVALNMRKVQNSISQFRNNLINKGLVYAPSYGEVDFTVPQFDLFLKRVNPSLNRD